jgi:ubiquitin carboxyl-terminal hydrolase L5
MDTRSSSSGHAVSSTWCTIESDPGVFTELITKIGVKDIQVEELYELDKETLQQLRPVYGLIFLFKYVQDHDERPVEKEYGDLFFANQVINNACATQAILSIILNCPALDIGPELRNFKDFTKNFSPDLKGLAISNCELVRSTHNSFARPEPFVLTEDKNATEEEDVYHFISYIPYKGILWELDGLKAGPINLGPCNEEDWLNKIFPIVKARIERYSSSEIRFNLMAIIRNRKSVYSEKIAKNEAHIQELKSTGSSAEDEIQALQEENDELRARIKSEEEKFKNWEIENVRRKHNYIPFVINLLKILGEKGKLTELIQKSQQKK